jgi:hypothetical protein
MRRFSATLLLLPLVASCPQRASVERAATEKEQSMPQRKPSPNQPLSLDSTQLKQLERELVAHHGPASAARVRTGLRQVLARWRRTDGTAKDLARFAREHFVSDPQALQDTARHLEYALEMLDGHAHEVSRELSRFQTLDEGPRRAVDGLLAAYSPTAHIVEDLFKGRIAFVALLNWPITTLEQRLQQGQGWSRERWALARLTSRFEHRVPPDLLQEIDRVSAAVDSYIDGYNVLMDHIELEDGSRPFRAGLKLISHWGLRDEIRGLYDRPAAESLPRQRLIATVMERIVAQQIPEKVIDRGELHWDPVKNRVRQPGAAWRRAQREPDTRYRHLLQVFRANRELDPYYPDAPSHIERVFSLGREIPEKRMRQLLESVVRAKVAKRVGQLIAQRLGRPLEPFDLWYTGFRPKSTLSEPELDRITRARYPDAKAFDKDLPRILRRLGFSAETARYLGDRIVVDPARGAGHAYGPYRREDRAHLRTRVGAEGMSYKGYNIAIHELGHNVEQVFSTSRIDHTLLQGVPNTGFTEAFAFLFQARDLELLGQARPDPKAEALRTLDRFWAAFEIAGVALLDMEIWHWMYAHPDAKPAELREAVVALARELWNRYYAPIFGVRDQVLPAIYSHIIAYGLYTPDYPMGKLITFQIEQFLRGKQLGVEMERMCRLGRLAPAVWMRQAVGDDLSSRPLLEAAATALEQVK